MPDPAEGAPQVDEHDLDTPLGQGEGQDTAGDTAADDEDSADLGLGHEGLLDDCVRSVTGNSPDGCAGTLVAVMPAIGVRSFPPARTRA
ncbi:hypothetical protein GCM10027448_07340 [Nocardioides dilutus]